MRNTVLHRCISQHFCRDYRNALKVVLFLTALLLLSGCSSLLHNNAYNLEKQIERQQIAQELISTPTPAEERTAEAFEKIGDRYMRQYDINRAYLYYMKGLDMEPDRVSLLNKQAALLLTKRKFSDAEAVFQKLLALDKENYAALEGLGKVYFGLGKLDEAERYFNDVLALSAEQWQAHQYLGLIASQRQDFDLAIIRLKTALAFQPRNETIANNLAVTHYLNGDFKEALRLFRELAKASETRKIHNNLALTYFQLGFYQEALASFKRGSENEAEAYNNIGYEFLVNKQYKEAIEAFEKAIDLHPRYYTSARKNLDIALHEFSRGADVAN